MKCRTSIRHNSTHAVRHVGRNVLRSQSSGRAWCSLPNNMAWVFTSAKSCNCRSIFSATGLLDIAKVAKFRSRNHCTSLILGQDAVKVRKFTYRAASECLHICWWCKTATGAKQLIQRLKANSMGRFNFNPTHFQQ